MFKIVYSLFYLLSLVPWRILYLISDGLYVLVYYFIGYRKEVVNKNLLIAFPNKTENERKRIAKDFYHNFIDTFIETIKLLSISRDEFNKRIETNAEVVNNLLHLKKPIQLHTGHFFNWEFLNLGIAANLKTPFVGVYMPLHNKVFDQLIYKLRSKFGTILIPATEFSSKYHQYINEPHALGLVADQNPGNPKFAYWHPFFNKMTSFVIGPEKGAKSKNTIVFLVDFHKIKRGYYRIEYKLLTTEPKELPKGIITKEFISFLETTINKNPSNYLWSHKRWKWEFDEKQHGSMII